VIALCNQNWKPTRQDRSVSWLPAFRSGSGSVTCVPNFVEENQWDIKMWSFALRWHASKRLTCRAISIHVELELLVLH